MSNEINAPSNVNGLTASAITGETSRALLTDGVVTVTAFANGKAGYTTAGVEDIYDIQRGDAITVSGCSNTVNNGFFQVKSVDYSTNTIYLNNTFAVDEFASTALFEWQYLIRSIHVLEVTP